MPRPIEPTETEKYFDVGFMLEKHGEIFTLNQIQHLNVIMNRSVYGAAQERWGRAFADDPIMRRSSLTEVGDEIGRRVTAYKAKFEQSTGTRWDALDLSQVGDKSRAGLKTTAMDASTTNTAKAELTSTMEGARRHNAQMKEGTNEGPSGAERQRAEKTRKRTRVRSATRRRRGKGLGE